MKKLSKVQPELGYHFMCLWDGTVDIEEEIAEAQKHCNTYEVQCDHLPDDDSAIIYGGSANEELNKLEVSCVHSYLLEHGWTMRLAQKGV